MGRRKKKVLVPNCDLCKHFYESSKRRKERIGNRWTQERWCKHVQKYVSELTEVCDKFKLSKYIWCSTGIKEHWVIKEVCLKCGYCLTSEIVKNIKEV